MRRMLVMLLAVLATGLVVTTPARAGGWVETVLDPAPARIEAGTTYTFGYWILQHGSYPYQGDGDLGQTALRATDQDGTVVDFPGTESVTEGHYSAEVVFPHDGTWTLGATHEVLMPDEHVATITVPGPVELALGTTAHRADYPWGAVRPSFPPTAPGAQNAAPEGYLDEPATQPTQPRVAPRGHDTAADEPGTALPVWLVLAAGLATVGLAIGLGRRYARANR